MRNMIRILSYQLHHEVSDDCCAHSATYPGSQRHPLCEVSGRFPLGNADEAPFPIARENQATKGSDSLQVRHESPQAGWKRVAVALYACQVGSARIQHLCFMSVTDCQLLSLTV